MKRKLKILSFVALLLMMFIVLAACEIEVELDFIVDDTHYQTVTVKDSEKFEMPEDPKKEGYVFVCWYWDKDTWQKPVTANTLMNEPLKNNMSVYARFIKEEDFLEISQIRFKSFEKTGDTEFSIKVSNDTDSIQLNDYVEISHTSTWTVYSDMSGKEDVPTKTVPLSVGDNVYYVSVNTAEGVILKLYTVQIRRKPLYAVSFDTAGGEKVATLYVEEDSVIKQPQAIKEGCAFEGWDYDFEQPITKNEVITASWKVTGSAITYELNGGSNNAANPSFLSTSQALELAAPVKTGFSFEGWYTDSSFAQKAPKTMPANAIKLYARWIEGKVTFVGGEKDEYASVQAAITAAKAGDTIFVRAGEYAEEIIIDKSLTLLGNNYGREENSRVAESVIYPTTNEGFNVWNVQLHVEIKADNVKVDGLTLNGNNPAVKNLLTQELKTLFAEGKSGWYTYNQSGLNIGDDLGVDGYSGIGVASSTLTAHYNNITITNNIVKNYNHAGIIMESATKVDSIGVNAVIANNIVSNIAGYGEKKPDGTAYGTYGRGLEIAGNMNVRLEKNKASNCIGAIMYTNIYGRSDTAYSIVGNELVDNSTGIWVNSNGGITEAQTTNPGDKYVIDVSENLIYLTPEFKHLLPFYYPSAPESVSTHGVVVITTERTTMDIRIARNTIKDVKYAVASSNIMMDTLSVYENTIENAQVGVALLNFLLGYDMVNYNNYTIAYGNMITGAEHNYLVQPVNAAKTAIVYTYVDILSEQGEVVTRAKVDVAKPITEAIILKDGMFVSNLYVSLADKTQPLPALDIIGNVVALYADWQADEVTGITILTKPTTLVYNTVAVALNVNKGVIRAFYLSGSFEDVSMGSGAVLAEGVTMSGFAEKTTGVNTLTVYYKGQSATYDITVKYVLTINRNQTNNIIDGKAIATKDTVVSQNYLNEAAITPNAALAGYTLIGYYLDKECTIEFDNVMPDSDLTVYCKWVKNS